MIVLLVSDSLNYSAAFLLDFKQLPELQNRKYDVTPNLRKITSQK